VSAVVAVARTAYAPVAGLGEGEALAEGEAVGEPPAEGEAVAFGDGAAEGDGRDAALLEPQAASVRMAKK
jgi:hypothetical protein